MSEQKVHVFIPSMDGEYVPVSFSSKDLKADEVFIILDEEEKHIFIWTGINSSVRKRFISSQIARQMRLEKGMTHRISTEEQGNETQKFNELLEQISNTKITAKKPLDVSPLSISTHPETLKEISPAKTDIIKEEAIPSKMAPPPPPSTKVPSSVPKTSEKSLKKPIEVSRPEILYFCENEEKEIPDTKAKLIFPSTDENLSLKTIHLSSAETKGKIALYYLPKNAKTAPCTNKKPFFVVYLASNTPSVFELDDLEIPIPAGNSIYFTCPDRTFIGLNLE